MKLKVYLAGASAEIDRVEPLMAALNAHPNVLVTYDWVKSMRATPESELDRAARHRLAHADRAGVREADIFWFCLPAAGVKTEGGMWELGYASALSDTLDALQGFNNIHGLGLIPVNERIITVSTPDGKYVRSTLFTELAMGRHGLSKDVETLAWVKSEAQRLAERTRG